MNNPEVNRWEKVVNSMRVREDRWAMVEEEGKMCRVSWKLYCQRLEAELIEQRQQLPQHSVFLKSCPSSWKKLDIDIALVRRLSVQALAEKRPPTPVSCSGNGAARR